MPFIDWSDPEEMMGLLVEYVADERAEARNDPERSLFLENLLGHLAALQDQFGARPLSEAVESLREIYTAQCGELSDDPVVEHVQACIEELERISGTSGE